MRLANYLGVFEAGSRKPEACVNGNDNVDRLAGQKVGKIIDASAR